MSFIQDAYAETTTTTSAAVAPNGAPEGDLIGVILPFVFIFVVFYFMIIRPQQKKYKLHQAMVSGIRRGDKVVTSGGIVGKVTKVDTDENTIQVEIAENVVVKVIAATVSNVTSADKPVNDNVTEKAKKAK